MNIGKFCPMRGEGKTEPISLCGHDNMVTVLGTHVGAFYLGDDEFEKAYRVAAEDYGADAIIGVDAQGRHWLGFNEVLKISDMADIVAGGSNTIEATVAAY